VSIDPSWIGWSLLVLTAATRRGIEFYDLSAPDRPRVLSRVATTAIDGALAWGRGILYWGKEGIWCSSHGAQIEEPIAGAERYGRFLILLTAHGISVHDQNLRRVGYLDIQHTAHMVRAGHLLVISTRSGVAVIDLTDVKKPVIGGSLELASIKAIASGKVLEATATVIALHEHEATLVQAATRPRILASYQNPPWAARACVAGGVWAQVADDRVTVKLYTLLETIPFAGFPVTLHDWEMNPPWVKFAAGPAVSNPPDNIFNPPTHN
jgi:hypothetical protein